MEVIFEAVLIAAWEAAAAVAVAIAQIVVAPLPLLLGALGKLVAPIPVAISQLPRQ